MKYSAIALGVRAPHSSIWTAPNSTGYFAIITRHDLAGSLGRCHSPRCRLLSSVSLAFIVTAAAALDSGQSPARATNECGLLDASGSATCTTAGNPYPNGINYDPADSPIHLTLQPGVIVTIPPGLGSVNAVNGANTGGVSSPADVSIAADGVTINNTANPATSNNTGLRIQSSGDAIINATNTTINVSGTDSTWAILDFSHRNTLLRPDLASVIFQGTIIATAGSEGGAIQVDNRGTGNASLVASGDIRVLSNAGAGTTQYGLLAHAGDPLFGPSGPGDASVTFNSGALNVSAVRPRGILAWVDGNGSATASTAAGTVINVSGTERGGPGVYVFSGFDSSTAANKLTAIVASQITSSGPDTTNPSSLPAGIRAVAAAGAQIDVTYTGPGITTFGGNGTGITALSSGAGNITVNSAGPINTTTGSNAVGILADSSGTVLRRSPGLLTDIESINPVPTATTGSVQINTSNDVLVRGEFGTGISATSGSGGVTVKVQAGSVMGGWQADLASFGPTYGLPAAGVILGSSIGAATLINDGTIGALSDRAVASSPLFASNNTSIINRGTITGFVQLVGDNNSFENNGLFNLRHFADTAGAVDASGNGVRDTLRVAVTDLGPGTFTNNGTLALLGGPGATKLDSTGQYLPLNLTFNSMALGGPVQGQILGATSFTNSGTIDLQANPVPGDVLVITGGHQVGLAPTPLIAGNAAGTFISNGGTLKLDTVLNQGGPASRSDVLVVDGTSLGSGGSTKLSIRNAGGTGALTVGDGILVVQVLDPNRSAPGVFSLAPSVEVRSGFFSYDLFLGGVNGSNPADWFLRNTFIVGPIPPEEIMPPETTLPPDPPPTVLPPGVYPIIGPEVATYGVVQPIARQMGLTTLGTLHERVGDAAADAACLNTAPDYGLITKAPAITKAPPIPYGNCQLAVWGRLFGQQIDNHYRAFADPRASGQVAGIQTGVDLWRGSLIPGHSDTAGLYFAYGNGNVSVDGLVTNAAVSAYILQHTGSLNLNAYSVGGYWTHYGPGGWYIDAVLQGSFYNGNASTQFARLSTNGTGFISSLEAGYPIPLPWLGPRFVLEPEGQIIWQRVSFDDANDGLGPVGLGTTSGATARLGLRGKWTINDPAGRVWQPYALANVWRDFDANATTMFGTDAVRLLEQATRLEFAGGLSAKILPGLSLYAQAGYQFAVNGTDGGKRDGVKGDFGVHYRW
ncbi:autotransporter outer membrane beta-barrel domain-containing protein [Bradyrhizobium sp.]|jgi:outer membrane autotransporter protein|uniref:autotransporter family protein n=1 Tax=Bradyrhizobium sp. TaxID=376 RepID=UPI002DDCAD48|nr:autotransporter outer membrane beta-barrel domain-containing protein [Bradyrhizobium sp.]HEV2159980.1 autotransporter outer membrane beta-barrel domain-containing protein [Bradyrhizobium sp.]